MVREKIKKKITKIIVIATALTMITPQIVTASRFTKDVTSRDPSSSGGSGKTVVVLDPGHGKSISGMSDDEKRSNGFTYVDGKGWGEWRHWKSGTYGEECAGSGCNGECNAGNGAGEWYTATVGDRDTEPEINLANAQAAQKYLEQMGYEVRMTRTDNSSTHESFAKRSTYCFPNNDTSQEPDAELYVCIHSNAGGGSGSAYISTSGTYDQKYIPSDYSDRCNKAGKMINDKIVAGTSIGTYSGGVIGFEPDLIAFHKNPVPTAYLEIGFFDNTSQLSILNSESDKIGKAIAEGIDEYLKSVDPLTSGSRGSGTSSSSGTTASKGKITITPKEEKFLGLWKNSVGYYVPYYRDADNAKYNPDGKEVIYGKNLSTADIIAGIISPAAAAALLLEKATYDASYGSPASSILNTDVWFFDLLEGNRTQQHLQLMKYLMQKYSRKKLWSSYF